MRNSRGQTPLQNWDFRNFWVAEEYRTIFCRIQKSASSVFQQLFLKLSGDPDYDSDPWHKPGIVGLPTNSMDRVQMILEDPNWVRAVVLRDPFERLISAYLHKISADPPYPIRISGEVEGFYPRDFGGFLDVIADSNGIRRGNPHWDPQINFFPSIDMFNHVIDFRQLKSHGQAYVRKIGAWEERGVSGWGPDRSEEFLATNRMRHMTNAVDRLEDFRQHESRVKHIYREDYALLSQLGFQNKLPIGQTTQSGEPDRASRPTLTGAIGTLLASIKGRF